MYLQFLWLLLLGTNSLVLCVDFPADSKKSVLNVQELINEMSTSAADKWAPTTCENKLDLRATVADKTVQQKLIEVNWLHHTNAEIEAGELGAFKKAFDSFQDKKSKLRKVLYNYLVTAYNSEPFQKLITKFRAAGHEFFYAGNKNKDHHSIRETMVDIWDYFAEDPKEAVDSAFEHVFFGKHYIKETKNDAGEVIQTKNKYTGLHSWYGYYLVQSQQHLELLEIYKHRQDVAAQISFKWKESAESDVEYKKSASSMLLNKSPAFEFSLYTALLLLYANEPLDSEGALVTNYYEINGCRINFKIMYRTYGGVPKRLISIYPFEFDISDENKEACLDAYNKRVDNDFKKEGKIKGKKEIVTNEHGHKECRFKPKVYASKNKKGKKN